MSIQTTTTEKRSTATTTLQLANSTVTLEAGPVGTIARVEHDDGDTDFAGPLPESTVHALRQVGR